jgi:hypothetical protein
MNQLVTEHEWIMNLVSRPDYLMGGFSAAEARGRCVLQVTDRAALAAVSATDKQERRGSAKRIAAPVDRWFQHRAPNRQVFTRPSPPNCCANRRMTLAVG